MNEKVMLFCGGTIEDSFALEQIKKINPEIIVGVDKGAEVLYRHRITPHAIVGDFDSVDPAVVAFYREQQGVEVRRFPAEKDETDTELAVGMAIKHEIEGLWILGATGTRLDHVMGNLQVLKLALDAGVRAYIVDSHNKIYLAKKEVRISKSEQFGTYFSLFAFGGDVESLSIEGAKYPLQDYCLSTNNSRCVSNEVEAEEAVIRFQSGTLLIMETRD